MTAKNKTTPWVRLGDYIEEYTSRLREKISIPISGIRSREGFIPTVANISGVDLSKYKVVPHNYFTCNLMHIGRDASIPIAYNNSKAPIAVSPAYYVFHTKEDKKDLILDSYLDMLLIREEFGRLAWFYTDSSIRGNLAEKVFCDIRVPLPSIEVQQELVDTYTGLKCLAEENEALIAPLTEACQAFIVDCQKKYPMVDLGKYIEEKDERNSDLSVALSQGIANTKVFQEPKQVSVNSKSDKIVRKGHFAYNRATTRNGEKISIAYRMGEDCTVSSAYCVFQIIEEKVLNPHYLWLWFSRPEFDRYARYMSKGSAHEFFDWEELCRVQIPLPPPEAQQSIVNLYHCIEEAKKIASEARAQLQTLCPALIQYAEHN